MSGFNSEGLRRLLLRVVRRETSQLVMTAEYRDAVEYEPLVAMLFSDNTIRVYYADTLELVGPVIDLRCEAHINSICFLDESRIVTGGADGYLTVLNFDSGCMLKKFRAHEKDVIAVDCWHSRIFSVGVDKQLRENRVSMSYDDSTIFSSEVTELSCVPTTVKIVELGIAYYLLIVNENAPHLKFYSLGLHQEGMQFDMLWNLGSSDECKLVDIAFNKTRTSYAAAFNCTRVLPIITDSIDCSSYLRVVTGHIDSFLKTQSFVVNTGEDVYSKCKVALSNAGTLWILDDNGVVSYGRPAAGCFETTILEHDDVIVSLYVSQIDGLDIVITGDRDKVFQWKYRPED